MASTADPGLVEADVDPDPIQQFRRWFDDAKSAGGPLPEAVALATATVDGAPSVRMVLLKGVDANGFVFFTNYESAKGRELDANPRAALCVYWSASGRQVRITGSVSRVSPQESDAYFGSRPRESQLSAAVSRQGDPQPARARGAGGRPPPPARVSASAASVLLGRLPAHPIGDRVLGPPGQPAPRPVAILAPALGRLGPRASQPLAQPSGELLFQPNL